ncbi:MAG: fumarylacetoacetate hydrolase family protein [Flavobacteriia bacterium]|nr:fumarylacetoacetate hydrolase family protein [Flavobacteriia bacterium]
MKIICIGRNYVDHAKEMNSSIPSEPIFFLKPETALSINPTDFYYPDFTKNLHYECEMVVKINKMGKSIPVEFAKNYYNEYSLGIDFTARDLQEDCKSKGLPWEKAKSFDNSAILSKQFLNKDTFPISEARFSFFKNEVKCQDGNPNDMLFSIDFLISYVSKFITLKTGDLIYTGTPSGVGSIQINDVLKGTLNDIEMFHLEVK